MPHNFNNFSVYAAEQNSQISEISEYEFAEAFSLRNMYQEKIDTIKTPQICNIVQQKIKDRFNNMNADEALKYVFQDSDFSVYQILKFPFGLLASCIYTHHEESEYWFFNETDYKFIAQTGTLPKLNGVEHCISKNGYMATWQSHAYDSNVDISIYKLTNSDIKLITRHTDVNISIWELACWGADNTFYICGLHNVYDNGLSTDKKYLKFKVSQ